MWAVMTRLADPKKAGITKLQKLKLYNGKSIPGFTEDSIKELKEEAPREGMQGISPRYIQDKISNSLVSHQAQQEKPEQHPRRNGADDVNDRAAVEAFCHVAGTEEPNAVKRCRFRALLHGDAHVRLVELVRDVPAQRPEQPAYEVGPAGARQRRHVHR